MIRRLPGVGLRGRLAISIALIILVALGITYLAVYRGTGADLRQQTDTDLEREAGNLARTLTAGEPLDPSEYIVRARQLVDSQPFAATSRLIAISIGDQIVTNQPELLGLAEAPGDSDDESRNEPGKDEGSESPDESEQEDESDDRESAQRLLTADSGFSTVEVHDVGDVRLLVSPVALPDEGVAAVRVGQPLESVERALDGLSRTFLVVGLLTLVVAAIAGWLLASRTAAPLRRMAGVAEGVDGGDISARMPVAEHSKDEVSRLSGSFNRMLDRLEEAFSRQRAFVADASHDLRTPLTIIKGQLEVLARNPDPDADEVRRVTAQVTAATARMDRLINDLLLLARADSGIEATREPVELAPLLAAEVEGIRDASGREIEVGEISGRRVDIDRDEMARAISNLVSNAEAYGGKDGRVRITAVDQGPNVVIAVEDDGPGVPAAMRGRVFDRFARLESSRSSESGGSGLGLAIVKAVVESQGGTVGCSASSLGGARFTITLPAARGFLA